MFLKEKKKKMVFLNVTILQYKFVSIRTRPKCRSIKFFLYSSYTQEDNFELSLLVDRYLMYSIHEC